MEDEIGDAVRDLARRGSVDVLPPKPKVAPPLKPNSV
jgi:hypothetical protein